MITELVGLCSMATKDLLTGLADDLRRTRRLALRFEARGGVEVVEDVRGGHAADLVVLSRDQLADLKSDGLLVRDTVRALYVSDVVAAVPASTNAPLLSTEEDLRHALNHADRIACSTGPSGTAFLDLLRRWGLDDGLRERLVEAAPGTPVGTLLVNGDADLGFQQRSELTDLPGVSILGPLPGEAALRTVFSGAVLAGSSSPGPAREALDFLGSEEVETRVVAGGMARA